MAKRRHLNRAPITEGLIDLHVEPRNGLSFEQLQEAFRSLNFGYYMKNQISHGTVGLVVTADGQSQTNVSPPQLVGLRLHSHDEKYVAQCRTQGFTLSRLPPYENWETLIGETKRLWKIYCDRLSPVRVTRIAARFINNLKLPLEPGTSFQLYLKKFADVPDEAPQAMASFFQSFQLIDMSRQASVNLTLALDGASSIAGAAPVILDIDAFATRDLNPQDEELWAVLECLRELKNDCFFGSLEERAVELYE